MSNFLSLVIKEYFLMLYINNLCIFYAISPMFDVVFLRSLTVKVSLFTTKQR